MIKPKLVLYLMLLKKKKIQVDHRPKYQRQNNKGFRSLKGKYIYDFDGRQRFLTQNINILTLKEKR